MWEGTHPGTQWQPQLEGVQAQLDSDNLETPPTPFEGEAITENCSVWCRPPHFGQVIFSDWLITSFSNGFLQSSQTYS